MRRSRVRMMLIAICSSSPLPKPLYERLLFFRFCPAFAGIATD